MAPELWKTEQNSGGWCEIVPSFAFMKILESTPERYDKGLEILSHGRIGEVYDIIAETASGEGRSILDIGCGTGNVSLACAKRGSVVTAIDINSGMLDIAEKKAKKARLEDRIEFIEVGVAEIRSRFGEEAFDACVSCLAFSEFSGDELEYAFSAVFSLLKPEGMFIIADEVVPRKTGKRLIYSLSRIPTKFIAYILSQTTTRPMDDVSGRMGDFGFIEIETTRLWNDSFVIIKCRKGVR